jgi:2-iminobutanoate/2-iminopropanoate deaminase
MAAHVEYLEATTFQKGRAYSSAVITQGEKTVWLAGQTATVNETGKDISGNFEAQARMI